MKMCKIGISKENGVEAVQSFDSEEAYFEAMCETYHDIYAVEMDDICSTVVVYYRNTQGKRMCEVHHCSPDHAQKMYDAVVRVMERT